MLRGKGWEGRDRVRKRFALICKAANTSKDGDQDKHRHVSTQEKKKFFFSNLHKLLYIHPRWIIQPSTWYGELAALQKKAMATVHSSR
jgi:hypothetical protein